MQAQSPNFRLLAQKGIQLLQPRQLSCHLPAKCHCKLTVTMVWTRRYPPTWNHGRAQIQPMGTPAASRLG